MKQASKRCDQILQSGEQCKRLASFPQVVFSLCWQHIPKIQKRGTKEVKFPVEKRKLGEGVFKFVQFQKEIFDYQSSKTTTLLKISCSQILSILRDYVQDVRQLSLLKTHQVEKALEKVLKQATYPITDMRIFFSISEIGKEIKIAKLPKSFQVVDFEPGTGRTGIQLASFLKAVEEDKLTCQNISVSDLILLIRTYMEDEME